MSGAGGGGGVRPNAVMKKDEKKKTSYGYGSSFQMPLHYPRFKKEDYEKMPEWKLDCLLKEYGLPIHAIGDLRQKRSFAIGAFLWPDQLDA